MKIKSIHINGFGVWTDRTWDDLVSGLNVFHGPNETGKSTLMSFIRSILFGFERRGTPRRYEPLSGGRHGGWLDVEAGGRRLRIERKPGRHVRGSVTVYEGDAAKGEDVLDRLLSGTTRTLYHNVFAFGLEELEQFHTLHETEIASHIYGAGLGIGALRWSTVQKDLEERQSALFLQRGHNTSINSALKELDAIRDDLDRTSRQPEDYLATYEARGRLAAAMEELGPAVQEARKKAEYHAKRARLRPLLERRAKIEARLRELPPVERFPEGGLERLSLLTHQLHNLESERHRNRREAEQCRLRRIDLLSLADPQERERRVEVIEALRRLLARVDATRRAYLSWTERRHAITNEKRAADAALDGVRSPSQPAVIAFVMLLWSAAAGLVWADQPYGAAALALVSVFPIIWYSRRRRRSARLSEQVASCSLRLDVCRDELTRTEDDAREIEAEIQELIGKPEIAPEDIDRRAAELAELSRLTGEIRSLDDAMARSESNMGRITLQIEDTRRQIQSLLGEASAASEYEFIERAGTFKQRRQLLHELETIPVEAPETGFLLDFQPDDETAFAAARSELAALEGRLAQFRHEAGRVEERIVMMEKSEERSRSLSRQETILGRIDEAAEQWAIITLCRALLEETRKVYENERQPDVVRQASSFFRLMTDGRFARVIAPLDGGDIQVERADGVRLSPQMLSRGTAEQLYLAMRLALVREYAHHVDPLPVVFDDIFVNFDPERTRNSVKAVQQLAASHQVLLFTCHPHLVRVVEEIVPGAKAFPLQ